MTLMSDNESIAFEEEAYESHASRPSTPAHRPLVSTAHAATAHNTGTLAAAVAAARGIAALPRPPLHTGPKHHSVILPTPTHARRHRRGGTGSAYESSDDESIQFFAEPSASEAEHAEKPSGSTTAAATIAAAASGTPRTTAVRTATALLPSPRTLPRGGSMGSVPSINFQLEDTETEGAPAATGAEPQDSGSHGPSPQPQLAGNAGAAVSPPPPQPSPGARRRQSPLPQKSLTSHGETGPAAASLTPGSVTNNSIAFQIDELASSATEDNSNNNSKKKNNNNALAHPAAAATRRSRSAGNMAALARTPRERVAEPHGLSPAAVHHTPLQPDTPDQALLSTRSIDFQLDEASQMTDRSALGPSPAATAAVLQTARHRLDNTASDEDEDHGGRHDAALLPHKKTVVTNRLSRTPSLTTGAVASGAHVARRASLRVGVDAPPGRTRRHDSSSSSSSSSSRHVPLADTATAARGARARPRTRDMRSRSVGTTGSGVSIRAGRPGVVAAHTHRALSATQQRQQSTATSASTTATATASGSAVRNEGRTRGSLSARHTTPTRAQQATEATAPGLSPLSVRSDTASRYRGTEGTATRDQSHDLPHVDRTALPTRSASQPAHGRHGHERRSAGAHGRAAGRASRLHQPRHTHSVITRSILRHLAEQERRARLHEGTAVPITGGDATGAATAPPTSSSLSPSHGGALAPPPTMSQPQPLSATPMAALAALTQAYQELVPADSVTDDDMAGEAGDDAPRPRASPVPYPQENVAAAPRRSGVAPYEAHSARGKERATRCSVAWSLVPAHSPYGGSQSWPVAVAQGSTGAMGAHDTVQAVQKAREEAARWHEYNAQQRNELMQLQRRIVQAEREDRTLLVLQSNLHETGSVDAMPPHARQTSAQNKATRRSDTHHAASLTAGPHTTSMQGYAQHSAPAQLSARGGAATTTTTATRAHLTRACHDQHHKGGRDDGRYSVLRSQRDARTQTAFLQSAVTPAAADDAGDAAGGDEAQVTHAGTAAREVAALLGVLWPPLRANELFFLTGARLTPAQVRHFYEAVRTHESAGQPFVAVDTEIAQAGPPPGCTDRSAALATGAIMPRVRRHATSSPPLLQTLSGAHAAVQRGTGAAQKRRRAVCRTKVLREVFDLLDVSRRGVLYAADLPTLKLLAERELATMDKIAQSDAAAQSGKCDTGSVRRPAARTAHSNTTAAAAGMSGTSAEATPRADTHTTSAAGTVGGTDSGRAVMHRRYTPSAAPAGALAEWDEAAQRLHQGMHTADAVLASADASLLLRQSSGAEYSGCDATRLQRRALLLSFAVNVVLPLAMMSAISPLSFATVSLLVLSAVDHAVGQGGQSAAATRVRAGWREVVQQYFVALS